MPVQRPRPIAKFKFAARSPMLVDGIGAVEPDTEIDIRVAKRLWGEEFLGSEVLWAIEAPEPDDTPQERQPRAKP